MDEQSLRGRAGMGQTAARGLVATALTLSLVPSLAYASPENEEETPSATNTEEASSQNEAVTTSNNDYTPVALAAEVGNASVNYDLSKIADGVYAGKAVIGENGLTIDGVGSGVDDEDEWVGYTVSVNVTVTSHAITKVEVVRDEPSESASYMNKAVNGTKKVTAVPSQIESSNSTDSIDAVTGATVSSKAIVAAVNNALENAKTEEETPEAPEESEYTYGFAAVPWSEYWSAEGVYNASDVSSSDELDSHGEYDKGGYDVVTRATLNHGIKRVSFQQAMTIQTNEGKTFKVAQWAQDQSTFTTAGGETCTWAQANGAATITDATGTYTFKDFSIYGTKYVPVKVKTSDLDAFKAAYTFYANDSEIQIGVNGEGNMKPYGATANVTDATNGLKEVTKAGDSFIFGKLQKGSESGIKGQELKSVDLNELDPAVYTTDDLGQFGEMMRVDFKGAGYGELGANMQSVTWTYYGNDSTRTNAVATYGTKFEADNWMHSKTGIQLGLTDSARCQFPENYDGTGYWTVTIHALGYTDSSYNFEAAADNIKKEATSVSDETRANLQNVYDAAAALEEADYTPETWEKFVIERDEAKALLDKESLGESEAAQQAKDLQAGIDALELSARGELKGVIADATNDGIQESNYTAESWAAFTQALANARAVIEDSNATDEQVAAAQKALTDAKLALVPNSGGSDNGNNGGSDNGNAGDNGSSGDNSGGSGNNSSDNGNSGTGDNGSTGDSNGSYGGTTGGDSGNGSDSGNGNGSGNGNDNGSNNGSGDGSDDGSGNGDSNDADNSGNGSDNPASSDQGADSASSEAPKTGDNMLAFGGAFAAIAAAAAGAAAWARRRVMHK